MEPHVLVHVYVCIYMHMHMCINAYYGVAK